MPSDMTAKISEARRLLGTARDKLDVALAALPGADEDSVMATPSLLSLLFQAVDAKRELDRLELLLLANEPV
jgi:hypothetical protein